MKCCSSAPRAPTSLLEPGPTTTWWPRVRCTAGWARWVTCSWAETRSLNWWRPTSHDVLHRLRRGYGHPGADRLGDVHCRVDQNWGLVPVHLLELLSLGPGPAGVVHHRRGRGGSPHLLG